MTERKRARISDIDPIVAPRHTADDVVRQLKDLAEHRFTNGFTYAEANVATRCDTSRLVSMLQALVKAEHLLLVDKRYMPQASLLSAPHVEFHGEVVFTTRQVKCRKKDCELSLIDGLCWAEICSICRNSHTHQSTEEAAWDRIRRSNYHANRQSHTWTQGVSRG